MTSDVINLRMARKRAEREAARRAADENAARHGLRREERRRLQFEQDRARAHLDGHRREIED